MGIKPNYKLCILSSLQIFKEQREKLVKNSKEHYSVIYNGLHESESENARNLYFQAYQMEWLDSHWNALTEFLKQKKNDYTLRERKEITLFFAEHFLSLMSEMENISGFAKMAVPELIKSNRQSIEQMIMFSEQWEEQSNRLKVNLKRHKEHFKRLMEKHLNNVT